MKIEYKLLADLIPYEFNNRTHPEEQINRIANSISQFGFNQPIVIDEQNIIIVGHGRFLAAKKLGIEKVPTIKKTDLSEEQKRAYRIIDNKLTDESDWISSSLELELELLKDGFDGFFEFGLDELQSNTNLQEIEIKEPPKYCWFLIGVPLEKVHEVADKIDSLESEGILIEKAISD